MVTVAWCVLDEPREPWLELDDKRLPLHPVDPKENARSPRPPRQPIEPVEPTGVRFQPVETLLDKASGRVGHKKDEGVR